MDTWYNKNYPYFNIFLIVAFIVFVISSCYNSLTIQRRIQEAAHPGGGWLSHFGAQDQIEEWRPTHHQEFPLPLPDINHNPQCVFDLILKLNWL